MSVPNMSITPEKLGDRDKCVAKHFSVIRRGKKSEAIDGIHVRMAAILSENGDLVRWRLVSIDLNQYERFDGFADTQALKVFPMSTATSNKSTPHRARTSQDYCNLGCCFCVFPHRHG